MEEADSELVEGWVVSFKFTVVKEVGKHLDHVLLADLGFEGRSAHHLVQGKDLEEAALQVTKFLLAVCNYLFDAIGFETVALELATHEMGEALLCLRENSWDDGGAYGLNEAKEAALDVLVIVSQQFVDIFVKILFDCYNKPLWVHFKEQEEVKDGFASQDDRLILEQLADGHLVRRVLLQGVVQLWVGLGEGNIYHSQEGLLDSLGSL